jgi:curved DNA-binding protein CbpA/CheY-like chemotaxis protein
MARALVLIVLEDPAQRAVYNHLLRGAGFGLVFAEHGEDGFDRFVEAQPDAIVAHLYAARVDGAILCRLVRQQDGGRDVPFVLIGEVTGGDREGRARTLGADAFLPYPPSRDALLRALRGEDSVRAPEVGTPLEVPSADLAIEDAGAEIPTSLSDRPPELDALLELPQTEGAEEEPTFDPRPSAATSDVALVDSPEDATADAATPPFVLRPRVPFSDLPPLAQVPAERARAHEPEAGAPLADPALDALVDPSDPLGAPTRPRLGGAAEAVALDAPPTPSVLDEPLLPIASIGEARVLIDDSATSRVVLPDMIAELPREVSARTDERPTPAEGRSRKGLDESQLGRRLVRRVEHVHHLLEELDYYQLLGVEEGATAEQLRHAYFELSLEFHPDRFFLLRSGDVKQKIYAIFRRVNEAYEVLDEPARRRAYDEARRGRREKRAAPELREAPLAPWSPRLARAPSVVEAARTPLAAITPHAPSPSAAAREGPPSSAPRAPSPSVTTREASPASPSATTRAPSPSVTTREVPPSSAPRAPSPSPAGREAASRVAPSSDRDAPPLAVAPSLAAGTPLPELGAWGRPVTATLAAAGLDLGGPPASASASLGASSSAGPAPSGGPPARDAVLSLWTTPRSSHAPPAASTSPSLAPRSAAPTPSTPAPDPERFGLSAETPEGRRYAELAELAARAERHGDARLFLAFALGHEPKNPALVEAFGEVSRRAAQAPRRA